VQSPYKPPPGHVASKKSAQKAQKAPSYVRACRFSLNRGGFATKSRQGRTLPYGRNPLLKLSKLLNQEDALSAPCYTVNIPLSAGAPSRAAPVLRTGLIRHFDVTLPLLHRSIMLASADAFRWLAAHARAERTGARPSRAVMARRPRRLDLTHTLVRFSERVEGVSGFLW
jgi:hypothetical protein